MVYRFLLTRRWLGLLGVALLLAVVCVALGTWQLDRLGQQQARVDLLERNLSGPPVAVEEVLAVGRDPREKHQYTRVRARGSYSARDQLLVRTRPFEGQVGFYVLVPLLTDAGPAVLVNRGWIPDGPTATAQPEVPAPPGGTVTVTGRVRPSEDPSSTGTPPPGQVSRIDVAAIARTLPYRVYGGYLDLTAERPQPDEAPALLPPPEPDGGVHLAYAFQWYLFALMALGGYVVLARREAAEEAVRR